LLEEERVEALHIPMKVQKFPQAHLKLTKDGKTLVIDPGYLTYKNGFKVEDFQGADIYLVTHQHADHLDPQTIKQVVQDKPVYGNSDVIQKLKEVGVTTGIAVKDREKFSAGGFEIEAVELPHFQLPNGSTPPPNTGFVIDGIFFHSGDGFKVEGISVDNAALALGQPNVSETSLENVKKMLKSLNAKIYIPIHYDAYPADPAEFVESLKEDEVEVRILKNSEETEI
jgi:L-ascorbate metabolism protein UlaG (beta-lactamase superfamily)